jgi:hypothetical protein
MIYGCESHNTFQRRPGGGRERARCRPGRGTAEGITSETVHDALEKGLEGLYASMLMPPYPQTSPTGKK